MVKLPLNLENLNLAFLEEATSCPTLWQFFAVIFHMYLLA